MATHGVMEATAPTAKELGVPTTQPAPAPASAAETQEATEANINKLNKIMKGCRTCMLTTKGEHGLHSRPMATAGIDFEAGKGEYIYFVTEKSTLKCKEIQNEPEVALVFSNDQANQWATVTAHATVIEDLQKAKELWNPMYNAWFPQGPETPGVVLIKAVPVTGSFWEGSYVNRLHIMFTALKARVTGGKTEPINQRMTQDAQTVNFPNPEATTTTTSKAAAAAEPTDEELAGAAGMSP